MKKRIAILGHFGGNKAFLDGQTVKTKILYNELKANTDWNIQTIDTYLKNRRPLKLLLETIWALLTRKNIIVLLSGNGMKFFFPILSFFANHWKVSIYHDVIGGNLDKYVEMYPNFKRYLNSFKWNWVETQKLSNNLKKLGVNNCIIIPNFKRINIISTGEIECRKIEPYKFCTFSRVTPEKGIPQAIDAVTAINAHYKRIVCQVDIYGAIEDNFEKEFYKLTEDNKESVKYCGCVPYNESVEAIKGYYALLFPTCWKGEGFPGTIVDAFSAGLPVIASNWGSNSEIVENHKNGLIYELNEENALINAIEDMIRLDESEIIEMRKKCIQTASTYQPEEYISVIINIVESNGRINEKIALHS